MEHRGFSKYGYCRRQPLKYLEKTKIIKMKTIKKNLVKLVSIISIFTAAASVIVAQTNVKTGTYKYRSGGYRNEISVQELEGNKLRVAIYASYEYKINGNLNANVGEANGIVKLNGDTAILVPEDTENCEISLQFTGNKIIVKANNEINCGFGLNVSAQGTYTKTGSKPDFNDSNEDSASNQAPKTERIKFAKGSSSVVISGTIRGRQEIVYLVGARAGQTMEVKVTEGGKNNDVVFSLFAPDGTDLIGADGEIGGIGTNWKGKLPRTGDYRIEVGVIESEKTNFKISVSIK